MKLFSIYAMRAYARVRSISLILLTCLTLQLSYSAVRATSSQENVPLKSNWVGGLCVVIGAVTRPTGKMLQKIADAIDEKSSHIVPAIADSKAFNWFWHDVLGLKDEAQIQSDGSEENFVDEQNDVRMSFPLVTFKYPQTFGQKVVFILLFLTLIPPVQSAASGFDVCHSLQGGREVCYKLSKATLTLSSSDQCYRIVNTTEPYRGEHSSRASAVRVNDIYTKHSFGQRLLPPNQDSVYVERALIGFPSKKYEQFADGSFAAITPEVASPVVKEPLLPKRACWGFWALNSINFYDFIGTDSIVQDCQPHFQKRNNPKPSTPLLPKESCWVLWYVNKVNINDVMGIDSVVQDCQPHFDKIKPTATPKPTITNQLVAEIVCAAEQNSGSCGFNLENTNLLKKNAEQCSSYLGLVAPSYLDFEYQKDLCSILKGDKLKSLGLLKDDQMKALIAHALAYSKLLGNVKVGGKNIPVSKVIEAVIISKNLRGEHQEPLIEDAGKNVTRKVKEGFKSYFNVEETVFEFPEERPVIRNCSLISFDDRDKKLKLTIEPAGIEAIEKMNFHAVADILASFVTQEPQALAAAYLQIHRIVSGQLNDRLVFDPQYPLLHGSTESALKDIGNKSPIAEIIITTYARVLPLLELQEKFDQIEEMFENVSASE